MEQAPKVQVVKKGHRRKGSTTDIALMVSAPAESREAFPWDKERLVLDLVAADVPMETAREVADAVEGRVLNGGHPSVTTGFIRELVDVELMDRGLEASFRRHTSIGLSVADLEQIVTNANNENSNTTHNPESVNLTLAETLLKQYALQNVFSAGVAEAHEMGDVHLHDLGFLPRPYSLHRGTVVNTNLYGALTLDELYALYPKEEPMPDGFYIKHVTNGLKVQDRDGEFVPVSRLARHARDEKPLVFIKIADGRACVVTGDHPTMVRSPEGDYLPIAASSVEVGDIMLTADMVFSESVERLNMVDVLARTHSQAPYASLVLSTGERLTIQDAQACLADGRLGEGDLEAATVRGRNGHTMPALLPLSEDLGWVTGFVIGDGHKDGSSAVGITINRDSEQYPYLLKSLDRLGIPYSIKNHGDRTDRVMLNAGLWSHLLFGYFGIGRSAQTKTLPSGFLSYPRPFLAGVVGGIVDSDGFVLTASPTQVTVAVASLGMVSQLLEVLRFLGGSPRMRTPQGVHSEREHNGRVIRQKYPIFGVAFTKSETLVIPGIKYAKAKTSTRGIKERISGENEVVHVAEMPSPEEMVYDITTESGTFLANGILTHNCSGNSIEYIKRFGLRLPTITSESAPARHAEVLIGHHVKMATGLQVHFAGAIGWDAVNMFYAPFFTYDQFERRFGALFDPATRGTEAYKAEYLKWVRQAAQMLIFEFNQLAGARGAQAVFTDFNLYFHIPRHYRETPAVLPGGVYGVRSKGGEVTEFDSQAEALAAEERGEGTVLRYRHFERESKAFLYALFEAYLAGDRDGQTFFFPKPLLHISEDFYATKGADKFMNLACTVASKQGITYFVFDRGDGVTVSQCCRLRVAFDEKDMANTMHPERLRFAALQNATLNLPRAAYRAKGDDDALFRELDRLLDLVVQAHLEKKRYINGLMSLGDTGPLGMLTKGRDGRPYMDMENLTYLVGLMGLNELVQFHTGEQLHESRRAMKFGLRVVAHLKLRAEELGREAGIPKLVLEESPAESSGYRLARLDMQYFPEQTKSVMKGTLAGDGYYYTNSVHLAYDAPVDYVDRVQKQSAFSPLVQAGSICLPYDQRIVVADNGHTRSEAIGDLVEGWLGEADAAAVSGISVSGPQGAVEVLAAARVPLAGRRVLRMTTVEGRMVECTEDHPVRALVSGRLEWVPAGNLESGQTLLRASAPVSGPASVDMFPHLLDRAADITVIDRAGVLQAAARAAGIKGLLYPSRPTCSLAAAVSALGEPAVADLVAEGHLRWRAVNGNAELPFTFPINPNLGRFVGFMLAEGYRLGDNSKSRAAGYYALGATFDAREELYVTSFENAFEGVFGRRPYRTYGKSSNHVTVCVADKSIHLVLSTAMDMGANARERRVPEFMYGAAREVLLSMVDAMFAGDGTSAYRPDGSLSELRYCSVSRGLREDLSSVLAMLGYRSSIRDGGPSGLGVGRDAALSLAAEMPLTQVKLRPGSWSAGTRRSKSNGDMLRSSDTPLEECRSLLIPNGYTPRLMKPLRGLKAVPTRETISVETARRYSRELLAACEAVLELRDTQEFEEAYTYEAAASATGLSVLSVRNTAKHGHNTVGPVREPRRAMVLEAVSAGVSDYAARIEAAAETLRAFAAVIEDPNHGFDRLDRIEPVRYDRDHVYDIMTTTGEFSVPSGLVCHNCHIWLGESEPHPKALAEFVRNTLDMTQAEQVAFSPEFTVCEDCSRTSRGLLKGCPSCGSYRVYWVTRIVGYYSKVQTWNKGKRAELDDRTRGLGA